MVTLLVTWAEEKRAKISESKVDADLWSCLLLGNVMAKHSYNLKACS